MKIETSHMQLNQCNKSWGNNKGSDWRIRLPKRIAYFLCLPNDYIGPGLYSFHKQILYFLATSPRLTVLWRDQRWPQFITSWCFHRYFSSLFASRDWFTSRSSFTLIVKCFKPWVNQKKRKSSWRTQQTTKKRMRWSCYSLTRIKVGLCAKHLER